MILKLARHPSRPERLALIRPDGTVSNWFGQHQDRAEVAEILRQAGYVLQDDDTVSTSNNEDRNYAYP